MGEPAQQTSSKIVVAIDGPAGAGKSSVTRKLSVRLGYELLDTGALYRTVALLAKRLAVTWDDEAGLTGLARDLDVAFEFKEGVNHVFLAGEDVSAAIRAPEMSSGASQVSALPGVRQGLLDLQRRLGRSGGVVVEGRDVGTVVFPAAQAKFFLTASAEVRARRRLAELEASGTPADFDSTLAEILERDERDSNRAVAPLAQADDAVLVDSSAMSLDQVVETMYQLVRSRE